MAEKRVGKKAAWLADQKVHWKAVKMAVKMDVMMAVKMAVLKERG